MLCCALAGATAASATPYQGVTVHSLWAQNSNADIGHELDLVRALHANVVRVDVGWSALETNGPREFSPAYLAKLDRFVAGAAARGMSVLPVVLGTPCWDSTAPESAKQGCRGDWWFRGVQLYPPADTAAYGRFLAWLIHRYGRHLAAVEMWNEPDEAYGQFWKSADPAGDYARLIEGAYPIAKAADPRLPLLGGSLSGGDAPFLKQLYAAGAKGFFDGIAVHAYNGSLPPGASSIPGYERDTIRSGLDALRAARAAASDPAAIWVTESGWTTAAGFPQAVTPDLQASYTAAEIPWLRHMPDVMSAMVFELRAMGDDRVNDGFALVNSDYTPRPAFGALAAALAANPPGPNSGAGRVASSRLLRRHSAHPSRRPRHRRHRRAARRH